jgi:hypothetical protein
VIALACIALGIAAVATAGLIAFAWRADSRASALLATSKLLDAEAEQHRATRGELNAEIAAHVVTRADLAKEKTLRASVEVQRNQAWRYARENAVKIIEDSGIADAVSLGNRILSAPLPGSVPDTVPVVPRSEDGPDALEKP